MSRCRIQSRSARSTLAERRRVMTIGGRDGKGALVPADRSISGLGTVVVLRWPEEASAVDRLVAQNIPCLLLVAPEAPPPSSDNSLVDWIRLPADDRDVPARLAALEKRSAHHASQPAVDADGILRCDGRWVALSPTEHVLVQAFLERFGQVVRADVLMERGWPGRNTSDDGVLRVQILRLRRRIAGLGLEVHTIRDRGYVLDSASHRPERAHDLTTATVASGSAADPRGPATTTRPR